MSKGVVRSKIQSPLQMRACAFEVVFGPLEKSQVLVCILQGRIYANRLAVLACSFVVSSKPRQHDAAEVPNPGIGGVLAFGSSETLERYVEMILTESSKTLLQSIILSGPDGTQRQ